MTDTGTIDMGTILWSRLCSHDDDVILDSLIISLPVVGLVLSSSHPAITTLLRSLPSISPIQSDANKRGTLSSLSVCISNITYNLAGTLWATLTGYRVGRSISVARTFAWQHYRTGFPVPAIKPVNESVPILEKASLRRSQITVCRWV